MSKLSGNIELSINDLRSKLINFSLLIFLIIFLLIFKKEPLHRNPDANKILNFTKDHISQKYYSDLNSEWLLSYIRAYSDKEIYADNLWIFKENMAKNWLELKHSGDNIRNLVNKDKIKFKCELYRNNILNTLFIVPFESFGTLTFY